MLPSMKGDRTIDPSTKLWVSNENRRKLNAILFIVALLSGIALCLPVQLGSNTIKVHYLRKIKSENIYRFRNITTNLVVPSTTPRWQISFDIPEAYDIPSDFPSLLAITAAEPPFLNETLAPYSLANVLRVEPYFVHSFGVLVYDPSTDKFVVHYSKNMRWVRACLAIAGSSRVLAQSLRMLYPDRFTKEAPEFALAMSSGSYPELRWNDCLRDQRSDCVVAEGDGLELSPILQFGSAFRLPIFPTMIPMPMPEPDHLTCYHHWAKHREVCEYYLPRTPDNPNGLVFATTIGVESWDDLVPQVIWRGHDLTYLQKMEPGLRSPDFVADLSSRLEAEGGGADKPAAATRAMRQVYEELLPRWKGVVLTAEAEREAEATNAADAAFVQTNPEADAGNDADERQNRRPVLPWANIKFSSDIHKGKKMPLYYQQFEESGIPAVGEEMSLEALGLHRYHVDLAGPSGTAWSDTLQKLGLPGLLFHHVTPTEDYLHGRLVPWVHYVPIRGDLSDLREKFVWAEAHPRLARRISNNAAELARSWGTPQGFEAMFREFFEGPLTRVLEAYRPLEGGLPLREAMAQLGGEKLRPIMQCGGYDQHDCEQLLDDVPITPLQFTKSKSI